MVHLGIFLSAITLSLGVAGLLVLVLKYRSWPTPALKHAIGLYASFLLTIGLKMSFEYFWINLEGIGRIGRMWMIYNLLQPSLCVPLFSFFSGMILASLTDKVPARTVRRAVVVLSAVTVAVCSYPFLAFRSPEDIYAAIRFCNRNILIPLTCLVLLAPALAYFMLVEPVGRRRRHPYTYFVLAINAVAVAAYVLFKAWSIRSKVLGDRLFMLSPDFYLFILAAASLAFLMRRDPASEVVAEASSAASGKGRGGDGEGFADADWERIEHRFAGGKLYRDPDFDLGALSRATGIPRKRISTAIRLKARRNFLAYLNEYRVREFLDIARSTGYEGDILSAAFEAGFNSKATFYSWFKKLMNGNPSDYLASRDMAPDPEKQAR
jgi:AraC-like DNA-binding protein